MSKTAQMESVRGAEPTVAKAIPSLSGRVAGTMRERCLLTIRKSLYYKGTTDAMYLCMLYHVSTSKPGRYDGLAGEKVHFMPERGLIY